jgi:uncharacterized protein (TIGR03435 family)
MLNHLLDVSIRSILLALLAVMALLVVRRVRAAAMQHAVWTTVVCGMLALFAFGEYLPRIPLPIVARNAPLPTSSIVAPSDPPELTTEVSSAPASIEILPSHSVNWSGLTFLTWLGIAVIFLLRFATGVLLARRLTAGSISHGEFRESDLISTPATVGCFRPRIVLPSEWRDWSSDKLHVVLTHEHAHVRRHDGLTAALAHLNRCIFWFHPLAWMLERRMALLAEQACDESCVATLGDLRQYTQVLIEIASAVNGARGRLRYHALTMAANSHIGRRIEALTAKERTFSRGLTKSGWAIVMLCGISLVLGAGSVALERPASAQEQTTSRLTFEVASIRPAAMPAPSAGGAGRSGGSGGGRNCGPQRLTMDANLVHFRCFPVKGLIEFAFGIPQRPGLITGPEWMMDMSPGRRFDIEAKLPEGASRTQVPEMLRSLLRDRFKLLVRHGTGEEPINAMVLDKSGLHLKNAEPNPAEPVPDPDAPPCGQGPMCAPLISNSHGEQIVSERTAQGIQKFTSPSIGIALVTNSPRGTRIEAPNSTLAGLAILLDGRVQWGVVDMSGMTGHYQIDVETSLDRESLMRPLLAASEAAQAAGPNSQAAIAELVAADQKVQEDLAAAELKSWQAALLKVGLRLEQRKVAAETLVVDHVERMPTEN